MKMTSNEFENSQVNNLEDGEVIYPPSKFSITSIKSNNTTTFSSNQTEKTNPKNNSNFKKTINISDNISTIQTISNVGVQNSFLSSTINNASASSSTTPLKDQKQPTVNLDFQKTEFEKLKNLESILDKKADTIEKGLLEKQGIALTSLNDSLGQALKDIDGHKIETKEELKETRNSVLGTIALFAAFFTFVSVNVNIFTKAETVNQSIIFMLSFWLCIIGFISLFFFFLNKTQDTIWYKSLEFYTTILCIFFTTILMYLLFKNANYDSYQKINEKISKIQSENKELKKENSELNKKISTQLKDIDEQIIELRKNQYQLNNK